MNQELNIILIEDDRDACERFIEYTYAIEEISITATTNNSYHALEMVKELLPDAIILDLELNEGQGNGLLFLQCLEKLDIPYKPYILITTYNSSSVTYDYARQFGADFIMSKYQTDYSEQNVIEFLKMMKDTIQHNIKKTSNHYVTVESPQQREQYLRKRINFELDHIGISPKAVGYQYLTEAILLIINEQKKNLCTTIAQKYGKSDPSVERAMQNAINKAWRSNDIDDLMNYYTARINSEKGVPTLTEFIYYYANKIKSERRD